MISSLVKYVVGRVRLIGDTDGTVIGNFSDRLKTLPVPDRSGSGNLTALDSAVAGLTDGCGGITFTLTGTWSGTVTFEGTVDGTNWFAVKAFNLVAETTAITTVINGSFAVGCGSFQQVRARMSAYTSGTAAVVWNSGLAKQTSTQAELLSPLPGFIARHNAVNQAGSTVWTQHTMTERIAITQFLFGGRGIGQASLFRMNPSSQSQVPNGGFNSSGDVSAWTNVGVGDSAAIAWVYSTAQFYEGTGSASHTFTKSDGNNFPAIMYTWSTPQDLSSWRYISARVRVTVATGGNQTRTASIILTDSLGSTRTYSLAGTTTTAPFNTEQWLQILGEIANPTSSTGTFDAYNVVSITLKLQDGGNKTGTVYWDDPRLIEQATLVERIYISANTTFSLPLNPTEIFEIGDVLALACTNNDVTAREFTCAAKGVKA
jgi:hypothetical protein